MSKFTQEHRLIAITDFSLGKDTFLIASLAGKESISDLFEFQLDVYSDNLKIAPDKILGKPVTVSVQDENRRYFSGYISQLSAGEVVHHNYRHYRLVMVPWLWFLQRKQNCRIFQDKNTKQIVSQIFDELGFNDYEFKAAGGNTREYCVQYHESDFDFVSRLLAEDGIAYYFQHSQDKHKLILVDQANAYEETRETNLEYSHGSHTETQIFEWQHLYQYQKGKWTLNDYNFKEPRKNLQTGINTSAPFANNLKYEHYEYASLYDLSAGSDLVKIRLESEETLKEVTQGKSDCSSFYAGGKFKLAKHDTDTEQGTYILASVTHNIRDYSHFPDDFPKGETGYSNRFVAIPAKVHFRPANHHKRPAMRGPQSALVVGPAGEEIYIDEHCRIKVQFYWDREGKQDENSSCFIRVAQVWAGNQWGASFIPRIGHEVIVTFLDGDPDRPLVTGSVYNGWNKPVYSAKTQSGIKSRSTKGGTAQNFNELRFEDKKGGEQVYLHAEKDFDTHVENDQSLTVEANRNKMVGKNETYEIKENRNKTIGGNQTETIAKNMTFSVGKNISIDIGENHNESVGKNMTITVSKDLQESVSGNYTEKVTKDYSLSAKTITLQADDQITLKTGAASIVMKKNGDITISGKNINVKGSGNVVLKGSKVTSN